MPISAFCSRIGFAMCHRMWRRERWIITFTSENRRGDVCLPGSCWKSPTEIIASHPSAGLLSGLPAGTKHNTSPVPGRDDAYHTIPIRRNGHLPVIESLIIPPDNRAGFS